MLSNIFSPGTRVYFNWGYNKRTKMFVWRRGIVIGRKGVKYVVDPGTNRVYILDPNDIKTDLNPFTDELLEEKDVGGMSLGTPKSGK